ncbi:MAG: putative nucleic acid-binding protein [Rhodothermales bacterium]|jgi:predicted nucleic acid-binding protein
MRQDIYFLWRPVLSDPRDDMVLEVGIASAADAIVTFNERDFRKASTFDIAIVTPLDYLKTEALL